MTEAACYYLLMKVVSQSLEETKVVAEDFLNILRKQNGTGAKTVGLIGDLGAGKTTFVQAIGKILGVTEFMTSPTFVIEKIYSLPPESIWQKLLHIDAYRLQDGEELLKLNFQEELENSKNLILIEWPENVVSALPQKYEKIYFKFIDENRREIEYGHQT